MIECGHEAERTIKDDTGDSGLCNRLIDDIHWDKGKGGGTQAKKSSLNR